MRTILLLLVTLALGACSSGPKPAWETATFDVRSERMLWEVLRLSLDRADFAVGTGAEPDARRIESAWAVDASPFKGRGFRRKAFVEYAPSPGTARRSWEVRVRVALETNESFKGLDLRYAEWKPAPDDTPSAQRVLQFARSMLGGGEFKVGPEPESPLGPRSEPPSLDEPKTVSP
jgi:hypothetical protein